MKKNLILLLFALCSLAASAAKVTYSNGVLTFSENTESGEIRMVFQKCMTNKLFTFYNIYLDNKLVNSAASSDNIGPFFAGGAWMGGNNNTPQGGSKPSAFTREVKVMVDDAELTSGTVNDAKVVTIDVRNEIFYTDDKKFADEYITYVVSGNSIEVWAEHAFRYPSPMFVSRYYGPQSMFPATKLLLPGTKNKTWISLAGKKEIDVMKSEKPDFSTFIERCDNGYQAVLKYNEGIGDASAVSSSGEVYLFRNYGAATGKSYHVLMWDHQVKSGDNTQWHALYSWFREPVTDTFDGKTTDPVFEYQTYIEGEPVNMKVGADGKSTQTAGIDDITVDRDAPFAFAGDGTVTISDSAPAACCFDVAGKIIWRGAGTFSCRPGIYIVNDMKGHSVKLIVK